MIPQFMEKGSTGPGVVPLLSFLLGVADDDEIPEGFVADDDFGDNGAALIRAYQRSNDLSVDGGCGPQTRADMLISYGFDFELAVRSVGGTTHFVQPDGTVITWSPEMEAEEEIAAAAPPPEK